MEEDGGKVNEGRVQVWLWLLLILEEDLYLCREGRSTAEEAALQEGFDIGYKQGFTWAKSVGKLRGRLAAKRVVLKDSGSDMELQLEELARRVEQLKYGESTSELEHRLDQLD